MREVTDFYLSILLDSMFRFFEYTKKRLSLRSDFQTIFYFTCYWKEYIYLHLLNHLEIMKIDLMNVFESLIDSSDLDWEWFYI